MVLGVPVGGIVLVVSAVSAQAPDARTLLDRVSAYVTGYYSRAQRIVATEVVTMQPMARDFAFDGMARRLVYELRVEWDPAREGEAATVVRQLLKATGPRLGPPGQPDCLDPRALSPEPLAFLLPMRRDRYAFSVGGAAVVEGRRTVRLDFKPVVRDPPRVEWNGQCGHMDLPGFTRGRIWADPESAEIVRFDEFLTGPVDVPGPKRPHAPQWFTVERADTTTVYKPVLFHNPDETLLLPARIESVTVIRGSGIPRMRITQTFGDYRRFVTESRIVP